MSSSEKTLAIYVTTKEAAILREMLGDGNTKTLTDGVTLKSGGMTIHETVGYAETYTFLVFVAEYVALALAGGLLSNYIYDRLKSKPDAKLKVGKVDVRIDKGEIKRIILENLELTEDKA
jgi:hypothetical protein